MKIIEKFKALDNINKLILVAIFMIMFLLIASIIFEFTHICQFDIRKQEGNDRWQQVENRIEEYENKIDYLETLIKK